VTGLRLGASWDYFRFEKLVNPALFAGSAGAHSFAAYASYQATEKLSIHGRLEYADVSPMVASFTQTAGGLGAVGGGLPSSVLSATGTLQYDLWKNVLSRVELRWDHALDGTDAFGGNRVGGPITQSGHTFSGTLANSFVIAANIIYKF